MKPMKIRHEFASRPLASAWQAKAGHMSQAEVRRILDVVLQTLEGWHRHGRWHGMLSLDDIWMDDGGNVQILPASGPSDVVGSNREGYAAFECHGADHLDSAQGIKADIYAAAAIAWSLAEGSRPPGALQRALQGQVAEDALMQAAASWSDQRLGDAVSKGLAFFSDDRPVDVFAMRGLLGEAGQLPEPAFAAVASVSTLVETAPSDDKAVIVLDFDLSPNDGPLLPKPEQPQAMPGSEGAGYSELDDLDMHAADASVDDIVAPLALDELPQAGPSGHQAEPAIAAASIDDVPAAGEIPFVQQAPEKADRAPVGLVAGVVLALGIGFGAWLWLGQDGVEADNDGQTPSQEFAQAASAPVENDGSPTSLPLERHEPASVLFAPTPDADIASAGLASEGTGVFPESADAQPAADSHETAVSASDSAAGLEQQVESEGDLTDTAEQNAQSLALQGTDQAIGQPDTHAQDVRVEAVQEDAPQEPEAPAAISVRLDIAPWAEVFVNGSSRGVSPPMKSLQLVPGTYQVELRNASQPPVQLRLQVQQGQAAIISHRFSSGAQ